MEMARAQVGRETEASEFTVEEREGKFRHSVRDSFPPRVRELRQTISGCNSQYWIQLLELLEFVIPSERQYEKVRSRLLKLLNTEEAALLNIVSQFAMEGADDGSS